MSDALEDALEESALCPSCRQLIPLDRLELHLAGLDGARPECPRTDLSLVIVRAREEQVRASRTLWTQPFSRGAPW